MVDLLQAAVIRRRKVRLTYTNRARARTERLVDPWGLVDKDDIWYLLAGTERGRRTFRVDRIIGAEPTDQPAERPDDFTLATAWQQVVGEVEQRRSRTWATVLIEARFVPVLRCSRPWSASRAQPARVRARWTQATSSARPSPP
jgi:predicted DNA-binding transcriptional regulator YafY